MQPRDLVLLGVRLHAALEVYVVALLDVLGVERAAEVEGHQRRVHHGQRERVLEAGVGDVLVVRLALQHPLVVVRGGGERHGARHGRLILAQLSLRVEYPVLSQPRDHSGWTGAVRFARDGIFRVRYELMWLR